MDVFISDIAVSLPNAPVDNEKIEQMLGLAHGVPSRTKKLILRNNGIKQRYFALDPASGKPTHTNAELVAESIKRLSPYKGFTIDDIELMVCGTSTPDQILPGHGLMVHGALKNKKAMEVVTTSGICLSGITALKYAAMSVSCGHTKNSVATGSEIVSTYMRAGMFAGQSHPQKIDGDVEAKPYFSFEEDFLRWMLSDGAAACFLTAQPDKAKLNLRIDWIDILSQAHRKEACMFSGAVKRPDGELQGYRAFDTIPDAVTAGAFPVKQDAKLLNSDILEVIIDDTLLPIAKKHGLKPDLITWYLPHYSSEYFRQKVYDQMKKVGFEIPFDRWFTNLTTKGNTGSASIFIMLEELMKSGKLKKGDTILCMIPESGRFSCGYMYLTVQ